MPFASAPGVGNTVEAGELNVLTTIGDILIHNGSAHARLASGGAANDGKVLTVQADGSVAWEAIAASTLASVLATGNTTGGTNITVTAGDSIGTSSGDLSITASIAMTGTAYQIGAAGASGYWATNSTEIPAAHQIMWSATATATSGKDLGLSRVEAQVLSVSRGSRTPDTEGLRVGIGVEPSDFADDAGSGQDIWLKTPGAFATSGGDGGDLILEPGAGDGAGAAGKVVVNRTLQIATGQALAFAGTHTNTGNATWSGSHIWTGSNRFQSWTQHDDDDIAYFGTGSDGRIVYSTAQTPDALVIGVGADSNALIVCQGADTGTDFGHALTTDPVLYVQSADAATPAEYMSLRHIGTQGKLVCGAGYMTLETAATAIDFLITGGSVDFSVIAGGVTCNADLRSDIGTNSKRFKDLYIQSIKARTAAADTTGDTISITAPAGGAHSVSNPNGGSITMTPGAFGAGGAGVDGSVIVYDADGSTKRIESDGTGLGFFAATPIAQPSSTGETTGFTAGAGTGVNDDSTFTGNVGATAYRISDVVKHLKNLGLIAA